MAYLLAHFELDDYDTWKRERFDQDPAGRKQAAKGHQIFRAVDDGNKVFIGLEFDSADEARSFQERLVSSGALEGMGITQVVPPTVTELADEVQY
jgi:hypothetical protein